MDFMSVHLEFLIQLDVFLYMMKIIYFLDIGSYGSKFFHTLDDKFYLKSYG